jgi:sulfur transfer protein SufE
MIRQDIVEMFYSNLEKDEQGRYLIRMGKEVCWL